MQTTFLNQIGRAILSYLFHLPIKTPGTDCQSIGDITRSQIFVRYIIIDNLQNRLKELLRLFMRQLPVRLFKRTDRRTEIIFQHLFPFYHLTDRDTKILRTKRFCDIHFRTGRKGFHLLFHLVSSGNHNNRNMRRLFHRFNPPGQFNATHSRHHDITDNHIRINLIHHLIQPFRILQGYHIEVSREDFSNKP